MSNTVTVQILADVKNMVSGINQTNQHLGGLNDKVGKVTGAIKGMVAGFAAIGAAKFLGDTITAASDLQETVSKSNTVFGENASAMRAWAQNAATSFGMSRQEALAGASQFGNFFDQIGIGGQRAVEMSQGFVQMATDLGSFNNAAPTDVMNALQSATRGEYDALQAFVPTINAAAVQAEAFAQTGKTTAESLTEAEKAAALYTLTQEGMGKAQGDFAKTSDGLANQQRILQAKFEDVKATIGSALLPVMSNLAGFILDKVIPAAKEFANWFGDNIVPVLKDLWSTIQTNVLPVLQSIGSFIMDTIVPALQDMAKFIGENETLFKTLAVGVGAFLLVFQAYNAIMGVVTLVTKGWAIAQGILNAIMLINPFVAIIAGIVALVAMFIYAWNHSETFRNIVIGVWEAIKGAVMAVLNWFTDTLWPGILGVFNWIKDAVGTVKDWFVDKFNAIVNFVKDIPNKIQGFFSGIGQWFSTLWNNIKQGAIDGWNAMVSWVRDVPGMIMSAVGNLGSTLLSAGGDLLRGLWNGISGSVSWLKNKIMNWAGSLLPGWVKDILGINSPSKVFAEFGKYLSQGLALGMTDNSALRQVKRATESLGDAVLGSWSNPALAVGFAGGGSASLRGGSNVTINVNVPVSADPAQVGREVVKAVQAYESQNGNTWRTR